LGQAAPPAILFKCKFDAAKGAGEKTRPEARAAKPLQAPGLINRGGFGAGLFHHQPPRFNQLDSFDQVSLTDLASLQSGDLDQDFAPFGHVAVNQFL
jgi:hypothetical protein